MFAIGVNKQIQIFHFLCTLSVRSAILVYMILGVLFSIRNKGFYIRAFFIKSVRSNMVFYSRKEVFLAAIEFVYQQKCKQSKQFPLTENNSSKEDFI